MCSSPSINHHVWLVVILLLVTPVAAQFSHPDTGLVVAVPPIVPVPTAPAPATVCAAGSGPISLMGGSCSTSTTTPVSDTTDMGCCQCPIGQYSADGLRCVSCVKGGVLVHGVDLTSTNAGPGASSCSCQAGYGDYDPISKTCRYCPENTYSAGSICVACSAGTFSNRGSPDNSYCDPYPLRVNGLPVPAPNIICNIGSAPANSDGSCPLNSYSTTSGCCACVGGQYSNDGLKCRNCLTGRNPNFGNLDVTVFEAGQCACLPGYGDWTVGAEMCRQCPAGTYSTNFQCLPCATNTFAPAGSPSCTAVQCPDNYYMPPGGTTLTSCVKCGYGTNGRVCGSMSACKCEKSFANFDKRSGRCFQCPTATSISIYANMTDPDESKTVCTECPMYTTPSANRLSCTPTSDAPAGTVSYPTKVVPSVCQCLNGYDYVARYVGNNIDATVTLDHTVPIAQATASSPSTNEVVDGNIPEALIIDQSSGLAIGMLDANMFNLQIYGSTSSAFLRYTGLSCAQAHTLSGLGPSDFPCITVPVGQMNVNVEAQLQAQVPAVTWSPDATGLLLSVSCGTSLNYLSCPQQYQLLFVDTIGSGGAFSSVHSSGGDYFSLHVNGNGARNFGSKVIAFYKNDAKTIQFVISTPGAFAFENILVTSNTFLDPAHVLGQPCALSSNVVACYPITNQLVDLTTVMNTIDPAAIDPTRSNLLIGGQCFAGSNSI